MCPLCASSRRVGDQINFTVTGTNPCGAVHFNFGDGEVVMMFWLLTGLAFAARRIAIEIRDQERTAHKPQPTSADSSSKSPLLEPTAIAEPNVRVAKARQN